jgi:hypothetical protein
MYFEKFIPSFNLINSSFTIILTLLFSNLSKQKRLILNIMLNTEYCNFSQFNDENSLIEIKKRNIGNNS